MRRARNPRNSRDVAEIIMRCWANGNDQIGAMYGVSGLSCEYCPGNPSRQGVCWKDVVIGLLQAFEYRDLSAAIQTAVGWYSWYIIGLGPKRVSKKDKESERLACWMLDHSDQVLAMSKQAMAKDTEWNRMIEEAKTEKC